MDTEQSDLAARHRAHTAGTASPPPIPPQASRMHRIPQSHLSRGLDDVDDNHLVRGYD